MDNIIHFALNEAIKQNNTNMIELCLKKGSIITDETFNLVLQDINKKKLLVGIYNNAIRNRNIEFIIKCLENGCSVNKKLLDMVLKQIEFEYRNQMNEETVIAMHNLFKIIWQNISKIRNVVISEVAMICVISKHSQFIETIINSNNYDKENHMLLYKSLICNTDSINYKFLLKNGFEKHIHKVMIELFKLNNYDYDLRGLGKLLDFGINIYMYQPKVKFYFNGMHHMARRTGQNDMAKTLIKYMKPLSNNNKNSYNILLNQFTVITIGTLFSCFGISDVSNYIINYYKYLIKIRHDDCINYLVSMIK